MANNQPASYSIPRSIKPIVLRTVVLVFVSDALLLITLLLIVSIRNILGVDAGLVGITIILFALKTMFTVYAVYMMLQRWLGVTYYVVGKKLYVQSEIRSVPSSIYELKEVSRVTADQAYQGFKAMNYGTIKISFVRSSDEKDITLVGVKNPDIIAKQLSKDSK